MKKHFSSAHQLNGDHLIGGLIAIQLLQNNNVWTASNALTIGAIESSQSGRDVIHILPYSSVISGNHINFIMITSPD